MTRREFWQGLAAGFAMMQPLHSSQGTDRHSHRAPSAALIQRVTLRTRQLETLVDFYTQALGLKATNDLVRPNVVHLSNASHQILVTLVEDLQAVPHSPRFPGLFHVAFLFEQVAEWKAVVSRAIHQGARYYGVSNHEVSWAAYFSDPEGNGIELYWDRPKELWPWEGDQVRMVTEYLPFHPEEPQQAQPLSTMEIGHVHLQLVDIRQAGDYLEQLDLRVTQASYPGAVFMARGNYHHHIAINQWNTHPGIARPENSTGLIEVGYLPALMKASSWTDTAGVRFCPAPNI
ncbi:VOC family protein [Coraliomargarita parva]|uniref:VOC family protein n=1 Tax=Coraliomargarita parva TaxID=3014050 RepID=UPI0022B5BD8E|nr:VOC family protein [Coraliomargarita parva]